MTSIAAGLSMVFPVGERFFVDSLKRVRDKIESPELAAQIVGFIAQEAMHGKEHRALNELLVAHGFTAAPVIEHHVGRVLAAVQRTFSPTLHLAATAALEHFTAILAEGLLGDESFRDQIDSEVRGLWLWHAFEETEHKAVAFDAFRELGGTERERLVIMILATVLFLSIMAVIQTRLLAQRGVLWKPWRWLPGLGRAWIWPGHFTRRVPAYLAYYRLGFHPHDRDTSALLAAWRERLFGERGELRGVVRSIAAV